MSNKAAYHASSMMRSHMALTDAQLTEDFEKVLAGHCFYLPHFFAKGDDFSILTSLVDDLALNQSEGMINWSKHFKHENPDFSPTFANIISQLSEYFDVEVYATRLNFYADGNAWKPFHHDSHAYGSNGKKEDFTMGVSFGAPRHLRFLHLGAGATFDFPQNNGDIFAFTSLANQRFQHGVPKANAKIGPRFSIIAWGRRRSINERNSAVDEQQKAKDEEDEEEDNREILKSSGNEMKSSQEVAKQPEEKKEVVVTVEEVTKLVTEWVAQQEAKKKPINTSPSSRGGRGGKSRIQGRGGWGGSSSSPPRGRGRGK